MAGSHVPKTIDSLSILYTTGSAVGPYRLVKTRRPIPPLASSSMHSASLRRSTMRQALTPGSGEAEPLDELRSASLSGIAPNPSEIHERREGRVSLHTSRSRVPEIVARAKREHPYEVPGVSARPITDGNPDYLAWIAEETGSG